MKTLYLHIGTPKTGTTAIQLFCRQNEKQLREDGIVFPRMPHYYGHLHNSRNGLFLSYDWKDKRGAQKKKQEEAALSEGFGIVRSCFETADNVLLSDEGIWFASHGRRRNIWQILSEEAEQAGYLIKIIVYLRRQDQFALSCWNQQVKSGTAKRCTWTAEEYLNSPPANLSLHYWEKLEELAGIFGRENLIVRRYERSRFTDGSIIPDFMQTLGLSLTDAYEIPDNKELNPGLKGNAIEFKRIYNGMEGLCDEDNRYLKRMLKQYSHDFTGIKNPPILDAETAREFLSQFEEGNRRIAREYFQEDSLLFDQNFPDSEKWEKNNEDMTDDLLRVTGMMMMDLRSSIQELKKEEKSLRKEIKKEQESGVGKVLKRLQKHP